MRVHVIMITSGWISCLKTPPSAYQGLVALTWVKDGKLWALRNISKRHDFRNHKTTQSTSTLFPLIVPFSAFLLGFLTLCALKHNKRFREPLDKDWRIPKSSKANTNMSKKADGFSESPSVPIPGLQALLSTFRSPFRVQELREFLTNVQQLQNDSRLRR